MKKIIKIIFGIDDKYSYLGYTLNPYLENTKEYEVIQNFLKYVDKKMRPIWCPKFLLRLFYYLGNDNSVVRVKNKFFSNLRNKIMKGFLLTDIKTKWNDHDIRIYGYFNDEIEEEIDKVEERIWNLCEDK
jgi:hypothetical protein